MIFQSTRLTISYHSNGKHCKIFRVTWVLPPYNNRFDRNSVVRHAPCLRKGRAGTAVSLLLRRRETAQRCPLNRALYGRNKDSVNVDDMNYRRAA
jgi:hypothetical protein